MCFVRKTCEKINVKQKNIISIFCLGTIFFVVVFYCINSFFIKPKINENNSTLSYFMYNYFNDILAGNFIAVFANILILRRNMCFVKSYFYIILWAIVSIIWEFCRPFILYVFNPFNKSPKFLLGDLLAYAIGIFWVYIIIIFLKKLKVLKNIEVSNSR